VEIHYFHIESCLGWRSSHSLSEYNLNLHQSNLIFTLSSTFRKGILIWNSDFYYNIEGYKLVNVSVVTFDIDYRQNNMQNMRDYTYVSYQGAILRAVITNMIAL
jgi:hypothetical protein